MLKRTTIAVVRLTVLLLAALMLPGCPPPALSTLPPVSPPKTSAAQALEVLDRRAQKAVPLRMTGWCLLRYHIDQKQHKENFSVKLWLSPPADLYMQGDVAFDATGIVLGSNENEFWCWIKPKEVSSYWWARWSQAPGPDDLPLSPAILLEALGIIDTNAPAWHLATAGDFDILTARDEQNTPLKRIHISRRGYLVSKIEYFTPDADTAVQLVLGSYELLSGGFAVPKTVEITITGSQNTHDTAKITIGSVKTTEITDKQRQRLFERPAPHGFKHVYQIIDGRAVELLPE